MYVRKCPERPRLVGDDVLLLGLGILDLGTLVEDLFGLVVHNDSEAHILGQFDDVIENLLWREKAISTEMDQLGFYTAATTPLLTTKPS